MGLTDNLSMMIENSKEKYAQPDEMKQRYEDLLQKGVLQKQQYDLPMVNVLGSNVQYRNMP